MTDTRVALAPDRLPWLQDVPERRHSTAARPLWAWTAAVILLVAGAAYWLGVQRGMGEQEPTQSAPAQRTVTTPLPQPQTLPPAGEAQNSPVPQIEPAPLPEVRQAPAPAPAVRPSPTRRSDGKRAEPVADKAAPAEAKEGSVAKAEESGSPAPAAQSDRQASTPPLASAQSLRLWPSRVTSGAYGRVVQIGAFGSVHQAKVGWVRMSHAYPGVKRLPAVVREARNSRGRKFYRFQIGTTSQAHSEVLCQRMQKIDYSCAVVGLPWKPKGVER